MALHTHTPHTHCQHTCQVVVLSGNAAKLSLPWASSGKRKRRRSRRSCLAHVKYLTLGFALHLFATHMEIKCLRLLWQQGSGKGREQCRPVPKKKQSPQIENENAISVHSGCKCCSKSRSKIAKYFAIALTSQRRAWRSALENAV